MDAATPPAGSPQRRHLAAAAAAPLLPQGGAPTSRTRRRRLSAILRAYHEYGLKHVALLVALLVYTFLGAAIFVSIEQPVERKQTLAWNHAIETYRSQLVDSVLIPRIFNTSENDLLLIIEEEKIDKIRHILYDAVRAYEARVGLRYSSALQWDFWNAMLYAWTIITTIGYGHLYPSTNAGRIATMIYAVLGIPLVLTILNDLGKLLTKGMKFPWFLLKKFARRLFQYCTKMTLEQIAEAERKDRASLEVFDLPIPVAFAIVFAWIFFCAAIFCFWETEWDYLVAFYFFFISLSTIGLGDIVPAEPHYLLLCFGFIFIGLSLVSMCINLIQAHLERTYGVGSEAPAARDEDQTNIEIQSNGQLCSSKQDRARASLARRLYRRVTTLFEPAPSTADREQHELFSLGSDPSTSTMVTPQHRAVARHASTTQTFLSFPSRSAATSPGTEILILDDFRTRSLPASVSIQHISRAVDFSICGEVLRRELSEYENSLLSKDDVLSQAWHESALGHVLR